MKRRGVLVIAVLEIGGGFAGLVLASQAAMQSLSLPAAVLMFSLAGLPMLLSLRAGQLLWKGVPRGRQLSILLQLCQVPIVSLGTYRYEFFVGGRLALAWIEVDVFPRVDLGARLSVQMAGADLPTVLGVNVLALWAAWYLWRLAPANIEPVLTREIGDA